jgi:4'-phosphopantetheinyl transferase EntD
MSKTFYRIYLSDGLSSVAIEEKKPFGAYSDELLFPEEQSQLNELKNEFRKIEFLGVRRIRNESTLHSPIYYSESRKPYLKHDLNTFISISHSKNYCALGISTNDIGIDIEEINPRIEQISSRFVNDEEKQFIGHDSIQDLTKLWTMKESMFKLNDRTGIEFKTELIIEGKSGEVYSGKMLIQNGWVQVKLECFQLGKLVVSACSYA